MSRVRSLPLALALLGCAPSPEECAEVHSGVYAMEATQTAPEPTCGGLDGFIVWELGDGCPGSTVGSAGFERGCRFTFDCRSEGGIIHTQGQLKPQGDGYAGTIQISSTLPENTCADRYEVTLTPVTPEG